MERIPCSDWLAIDVLLGGCCSGTLSEWPVLMHELKQLGYDFDCTQTCLEVKQMLQTDQLAAGEGQRKLVTIRRVSHTEPHPNADRLELVRLENCMWQIVGALDMYKPGDYVVMFEADSVLPDALAERLDCPARVKPVKLRGVQSDVMIRPLAALAEIAGTGLELVSVDKVDFARLLGVTKYVAPVSTKLAGDMSKTNLFSMGLVPKTDELRLQSEPWLYNSVCAGDYFVTQKLDGTSATFAVYDGAVYIGSRQHFLTDKANAYYSYAERTGLLQKLELLAQGLDGERHNFAIQGELCGPKIQDNRLRLEQTELYVFRIWDIDQGKAMTYLDMQSICDTLGLTMAPMLMQGSAYEHTADDLIAYADTLDWFGKPAEGIVVVSADGQSSFKVIHSQYRDKIRMT